MKDTKTEIKRINGYLKEVITFLDSSGQPIHQIINPLMTELRPRDIAQIFVGVLIFGAPICFTEEVWKLSEEISKNQIILINISSVVLLFAFIYFNFYRFRLSGNVLNFLKRSLMIILITYSTITYFLFLIGKLPLDNSLICYNRVSLISFPCIFSAAISDMLK